MSYDPATIEARWRARWAERGTYEADPDDRSDPTFVTVPYPYPSGGMHIGHGRTYTVPDVYARYRRQRGDNVLFTIGWHVTGTPIIGAVERVRKREAAQLRSLREAFKVPDADLERLEEPMSYARYFIEEADCSYVEGMQAIGHSIDWRREFTTNDERYQRFISWQYETLRERGLLEKGLHPVNYCTNDEQPVTTHDLLEGEDAEFQEYTLIKFEATATDAAEAADAADGEDPAPEGVVYPMATLRPETVRGVTNAFVDPEAEYVRARVDGEPWIVSREATEKLDLQARDVAVEATIPGADLVGERFRNPVTGEDALILPATFVDVDAATGVVMSVPAHSPDDWIALEDAKDRANELAAYGIDPAEVRAIEPRAILDIEGYGEYPARDAIEAAGITDQDDPALEDVTQELYNREFHQGVLGEDYGEFAGRVIEDVREALRDHYERQGAFDSMYDYTEEVICRCGGDVEVAEQETWFLRYNDADWREKARRAIARIDAIPERTREQYEHTVGWLEEWPCIRNYGLGTRLPWDDEFVIEPLSDSTIYMAYYTFAHHLEEIPVEDLDRAFFDALFFGPDAVEDPDERALELREEWSYWYPVDYRCSAHDLISNHLTFYLYHHAELFEEPQWPLGITAMGMGQLEGESMSSSRGHVVLLDDAIERHGADTVRFFLLNSSEPWQDFDWRGEDVRATREQLDRFWNRAMDVIEMAGEGTQGGEVTQGDEETQGDTETQGGEVTQGGEDVDGAPTDRDPRPTLERVDRWLLARLQETVREVTDALERFETRTASQAAFYRFEEDLRWYRRRTDLDRPGARWTRRVVLETRLRLLAPFVPFMANELHERLTGTPAEAVPWPEPVPAFEDERVLAEEELVETLLEDVRDIVTVTGTDPETIRVYTAPAWKRSVFETAVEVGPDVGAVMGAVMDDPAMRERGDAVNDLVVDLVDVVREREADRLETLLAVDEARVYADAASFLGAEFDAEVVVTDASEASGAHAEHAADARPLRPAVELA